MIFSQPEIENLKNLINKDVLTFIGNTINPKYLSDNDKLFLQTQKVDISKFTPPEINVFDLAFKFGMFVNDTNFHTSKNITQYQFEQILKSNKFLPLDSREENALDFITQTAVRDIKNFSNDLQKKTELSLSEINTQTGAKYENILKDNAKLAILKRQSTKDFASELRNKTKDITRDWLRVSQTVLHTAFDEGLAKEIERVYGVDAMVYKHVYSGSCIHCEKLYLEKSGKPKTFKLSVLRANGTNIGRKVADWKEVVGSTHPYCRCTLTSLPPYYKYNEQKKVFAPSFDKDKLDKELEYYQQKLYKLRGQRSTDILELNDIKKGYFNNLAIAKLNESNEHGIIQSQYNLVNQYEKDFNIKFLSVLSNLFEKLVTFA